VTELTTEMLTTTWYPIEVRLSPDGSRAAWVAAPYGTEGEHEESAIWVASVEGTDPGRRWTFGGKDTMPRWSPDGTRLAFLSDRAKRGTAGLYVIPSDGGEAEPGVVRERAISAFAWSPDGGRLAFSAPDEPDEEDKRREREHDDAEVFGERWQAHRLWSLELASGEVTPLDHGDGHVVALDWSPDGELLAVLVRPTPELDTAIGGRICLVSAAGGDGPGQVCAAPGADDVCFAAGGHRLVFVAYHERNWVSAGTVWSVRARAGSAPTVVGPRPDETACAVELHPVPGEDRVVIGVAEGLDTRLEWCHPETGEREVLWRAEGEVACFDVAQGPVLATAQCAERGPLEVWVGTPSSLRSVSDHHSVLKAVALSTVEDFRFHSPDGWELDGVVIPPQGAGAGPWPTIVLLHGGPYGRSGRQLHLGPLDWGQWLAAAGYAVLMPNYRGGLGRGQAFAASVRGDMGGAEWRDVLAAVDAAVEGGIADPERLGVGGWSQGGFLSAWAVTQTDRFKAAVVGAGVTDWSMLSLTSDVPSFEAALAGGIPWQEESRRHGDARSPLVHAGAITTPLLILHGAGDERVPATQGSGLHRALRGGDVPVELVTYPREPHGVRERAHQADILRRVRAWYDRWLSPEA
jgi:dipeptidyl aminopeptidase/acylaminoacyl peptidase